MSLEPKPPKEPYKGEPITCPKCEHKFYRPRSRHGAGYAQDWDKLPVQNKELLAYLWSRYQGALWSKNEIIKQSEFPISVAALGGRISEYRAWDLVIRHRIKIEDGTYIVKYALDLKRTRIVLEHGGSLLPLKHLVGIMPTETIEA